jgi:O-acetylserine/cysteine efflux transporter
MRLYHHLFAVLIAALWGGNYVAAKIGMAYFPPIFYTMLRFWLTAMVLLPFLPRVNSGFYTPAMMQKIALNALVLCVGHMAFILVAMHEGLNIAASVVIVQLGVPFSCLLGVLFLGDKIGRWRVLGLIIAFTGVMLITGSPNITEHPIAFFIALGATFAWAVSNILMKQLPPIDALPLFSLLAIFAFPMLAITSYLFEYSTWRAIHTAPANAWMALCYTVSCSTIIAYGGWAFLIRRYQVSTIAPYSLLVPVFGIASGALWFGEMPTHDMLIGGAVIIAGVAIITLRRPKIFMRGSSGV